MYPINAPIQFPAGAALYEVLAGAGVTGFEVGVGVGVGVVVFVLGGVTTVEFVVVVVVVVVVAGLLILLIL